MSKLTDEIMGKLKDKKAGGGSLDLSSADEEEPAEESEEGDYAGDKVAAMQDFMDAEDAEGKASALEAFIELCKGG